MEIKELIQAGQLAEARQRLVAVVRESPSDTTNRTLLFQVLCYLGEWDKADRHLQAIAAQDSRREAGILGYKNIVHAEVERHHVINNRQNGSFISDPPDYLGLFSQVQKKMGEGKVNEAEELLVKLDSNRPVLSGTVNDTPFVGFCDTDTTLFPFLEVFTHERYLWVPFESIRELSLSKPNSLLDLLWIAARITTWEGVTMNCFLPVLYPNSFLHEDERIKMGRMTDWQSLAGPYARGVGQHVFAVGGHEMAILEIQDIVFSFPGKEQNDEENN